MKERQNDLRSQIQNLKSKMEMVFQEVSSELLRLGYSIRFRPAGQSMQPTIRDGEAIMVAPATASKIRRGDILLYSTGESLIAHRVVRIACDKEAAARFILRGDSSVSCDAPVSFGQILGHVICVERAGRSVRLAGRRARIRHIANAWAAKIKRRIAVARRRYKVSTGKLTEGI